jgi:hypothetical protein
MAIEKMLGTEGDPDIIPLSKQITVTPELSREDMIREAAQILVSEEEILIDDEIDAVPEKAQIPFDSNLVDFLDKSDLGKLASDVLESIDSDKESRSDWEKTYVDGLKYLGMKFDETRSQPFQGSSGVIHPILAESVTQFQAQAYKELLPAKGPVKTEIIGARTPEVEMQAQRVGEFMNFYIMNVMKEYDPEMDMLLFYLPIAGSAFKKVYYDQSMSRAVSKFIAPEDLIVPYEASDILSAERVTHVISMSKNEIRKQQLSGFYADIELKGDSYTVNRSEIKEQVDEIEGQSPSYSENRDRTVYEVHTILDLPGYEDVDADGQETGLKLPYIVTIDEQSQQVLAIRRNYVEQDITKQKVNYFVQYKFLPGLGFYGLGLSHMIGGLRRHQRLFSGSSLTPGPLQTCLLASRPGECEFVTKTSLCSLASSGTSTPPADRSEKT